MVATSQDRADKSVDLIVLLDSSESVLPWFRDVCDYLIGPFVKEYLRLGDTFHLVSYGEKAQVEIVETIRGEADVKAVLGRLYLLYPLDPSADFIGALRFLGTYIRDLPGRRSKIVVIVSDGLQSPAPGSPFAGLSDEAAATQVKAEADSLRRLGWPVHFIKLPFETATRAGAKPAVPAASLATGTPEKTASEPGRTRSSGASVSERATTTAASSARGSPSSEGLVSSKAPLGLSTEAEGALGASVSEWKGQATTPIAATTQVEGGPPGDSARVSSPLALPMLRFPAALGKRGRSFSFPLEVVNPGTGGVRLELVALIWNDEDILAKKTAISLAPNAKGSIRVAVSLPQAVKPGRLSLPISPVFAAGIRTNPQDGVLDLILSPSPLESIFAPGTRILAIVLGISFLIGLGLFLILGRIPFRANAPMVAAVRRATLGGKSERNRDAGMPASSQRTNKAAMEKKPDGQPTEAAALTPVQAKSGPAGNKVAPHPAPATKARSKRQLAEYAPRVKKHASVRVELRVTDQNSHIGHRNIHELHSGSSLSVGGGRSDFLVFLVAVPRDLARLHFDGESCVFVPLREEFFPELSGPIEGCLGKHIPLISQRGYPLWLHFAIWEEPADRINRLLHCIERSGPVDFLD
jgi:hypothetical protein